MTSVPLSGIAHRLAFGAYEATIASVGASLRTLRFDGRDLVLPFAENELRPAYRGATLAPWPNRIVDGTYEFEGTRHQLSLTEPLRGHALHGLVAWLGFRAVDGGADRVTLAATIEPQEGYPWRVDVVVRYLLGAGGLTQVVSARNTGRGAAPWGAGAHPYLVAARSRADAWTLELDADEVLIATADRFAPWSWSRLRLMRGEPLTSGGREGWE